MYLNRCLVRAFLFDESSNDNDVDVVYAMRCNEKSSKLAILRFQKLCFVNSQANSSVVVEESGLSFPMTFPVAELKRRIPMEKGKSAVYVLQLKRGDRSRTLQFNLGCSVLSEKLRCAGDDGAGFVSFVDFDMVARVGLAIVFDFLPD